MTTEATEARLHGYAVHPAADVFPLLDGDAFADFVADVRVNGQREPVTLDAEDRLLDGRNRVRACAEIGVEPTTKRFDGDDVIGYVVSHNLHRRHLTDAQRAMIGARLARLPHGGDRKSNGIKTSGDVLIRPTHADVEGMLHVSSSSLDRAKTITRSGTPDLQSLATDGVVPLSTGERVARLEPDEQQRYVETVRDGGNPTRSAPPPRTKPQWTKAQPIDRSPDAAAARRDRMRQMADERYTSRQIAKAIGISEQTTRQTARDYGIDIPADRAVGKTQRAQSDTIASKIIAGLEGTQTSIELIDFDEIDPDDAAQWLPSLDTSLRTLSRFRKRLREVATP